MENHSYRCPICNNKDLTLRYEASYVYSYVIDSDAPGLKNSDEFLSFLYDKREQKDTRTYIECNNCGTQYPHSLLKDVLSRDSEAEEKTDIIS